MEYRLHLPVSKFDWSVFLNLRAVFYFFGIYMAWFFYLESIRVYSMMDEKKAFQFLREI